jgi:hypothetical protein
MSKKNKKEILCFLNRIKDTSLLVPGKSYYIRKLIKKGEPSELDDSRDAILKEFSEGFFIVEDTEEKYLIGPNEYEIFVRSGL